MQSEFGVCHVGFAAQMAGVRALSGMHAGVGLEVAFVRESSSAAGPVASKRSFSGVGAQVPCESLAQRKCLVA